MSSEWNPDPGPAPAIAVEGRRIGLAEPPYIVAELSGNHNGDLDRALRLVDAARDAGADAVKLQTYRADTITLDADGPAFRICGGPWDGQRLYDLYSVASTPWDWHAALFARARGLGLPIFSTPFDPTAIDFLETLGAPAYKIASFEIVDLPLIRHAAMTGKPLILSTGMASAAETAEAIEAAREAGAGGIAVLHCVSGYPTPVEEANLLTIPRLAARHGLVTGFSDHTMGTAAAVAAVALGARIIEKHLTLDRSEAGPDAAFSLEPAEFAALTRACREAFSSLGEARGGLSASEHASAPLRRSLFAVEEIRSGERFTERNVRSIRPGHGLPPKHLPEVLGLRAGVDIARGTPLSWDHVERP